MANKFEFTYVLCLYILIDECNRLYSSTSIACSGLNNTFVRAINFIRPIEQASVDDATSRPSFDDGMK